MKIKSLVENMNEKVQFYLNLFSLANCNGTKTNLRRARKLKMKKKIIKNKIVLKIFKICNKILELSKNIRKERITKIRKLYQSNQSIYFI